MTPFLYSLFSPFFCRENGGRIEEKERGGVGRGNRRLGPAIQTRALYEKKTKKKLKPWWKIEIILIRSDSACQ